MANNRIPVMMKPTSTLAAALLSLLFLLPTTVSGADSDDMQGLVEELRTLADQARRQRAADRWLLESLDDLVTRYDRPRRNLLVTEDFSDGDFSQNPAWQTQSGQFWIDRRLGLRSRVTPEAQQSGSGKKQDLGEALLGALIDEALGPDKESASSASQLDPAEIHLPLRIPTEFSLETSFSFHGAPGETSKVGFALLQNQRGSYGYQVNLYSAERSTLELTLWRGGRVSTLETAELEDFDPSQQHTLEWRHDARGNMELLLDGTQLIRVRERSFRDPFDRFALINSGGDFALQSLSLYGTQ
jgi:hypothetical protein